MAQLLVARFRSRVVILAGLATFLVSLALIVAGLSAASLVLFVVGTVVGGVGVGGAFVGSLSTANRLARPTERGRALSTFFVFCYIGLAIPVVGVGFASPDVGDFRAVLVCAIVLAAVSVMSMAGQTLPRPRPRARGHRPGARGLAGRGRGDDHSPRPDARRAPPGGGVHPAPGLGIRPHPGRPVPADAALPYFDLYRKQVVKQANLMLAIRRPKRYILTGGDPLEILHHGQPRGREPAHRLRTGNARYRPPRGHQDQAA